MACASHPVAPWPLRVTCILRKDSWEGSPAPSYQADPPSNTFTGNFEVGVHIADVSYFIPEGSDLDEVAAERATSVYLVQKVTSLSFSALPFFCFSLL